jgi:large subunit ribosomal protein L13
MKTSTVPVSAPQWHIVDASGQSLGRMATAIAHVLRGKNKPTFSPHQLCGDQVVVVNAAKIKVSNRQLLQKEFVHHTGYIGNLKAIRLKDLLEKKPDRVVQMAVTGMLPKNKLRVQMLKRLHIYAGDEHNHEAQNPTPLTLS